MIITPKLVDITNVNVKAPPHGDSNKSHNSFPSSLGRPTDPALLDAADRRGLMVWDEARRTPSLPCAPDLFLVRRTVCLATSSRGTTTRLT